MNSSTGTCRGGRKERKNFFFLFLVFGWVFFQAFTAGSPLSCQRTVTRRSEQHSTSLSICLSILYLSLSILYPSILARCLSASLARPPDTFVGLSLSLPCINHDQEPPFPGRRCISPTYFKEGKATQKADQPGEKKSFRGIVFVGGGRV